MKKKIIIILAVCFLIFFLSGIYMVVTIERGTATLDKIIVLHQVEILREHLLIQVKRVQAALTLRKTVHAKSMETIVRDVTNMERLAWACFDCHHTQETMDKLEDLRAHITTYKNALSRVFTIRANAPRLFREEDNAYDEGQFLITSINKMIAFASTKLERKTQATLEEIHDTKIALYLLMTVVPLLLLGLGLVFIRGITRPIDILLNATRRLKGGDLDFRVEGLHDEFGEVAASFNEMAGSLREQMAKMQRTEQMVVLGEIAAGLAHEIKNPISAINVSVDVLLEELDISEEDRSVLLKVGEEVKRIELLIKGLLNFARPQAPQYTMVDINKSLDRTVSLVMKHPSFSSILVEKEYGEGLPEIVADPMQLQQIFLNLLLNSVESMPEGGTISLRTSYLSKDNSVEVRISDTGKGISDKMLSNIFKPFFTTKTHGTGLGLAITKQIVEQHNGSITASNNHGGGLTFSITLPVSRGKEAQAA